MAVLTMHSLSVAILLAGLGLAVGNGRNTTSHRRHCAPLNPVYLPGPAPSVKGGEDLVHKHAWGDKPLIERCKLHFRNTTLDHFSWVPPDEDKLTYRQRYFVCSENWRPDDRGRPGPIFFYAGNEADVTLYLNATGLMWESAPSFGALLVFAEHRYYGESKPFSEEDIRSHMQYLSSDQAMADYAELITELKEKMHARHAPVIAFGGSYGGMLAAWMRMKYPHILDGAIAASAPIWTFEGEEPAYDYGSFAKVITYAASPEAGSSEECVPNVRRGWQQMFDLSHDQEGRDKVHAALRLCKDVPLDSAGQVLGAAYWMQSAWDYMAMGNFPYASSYILNGRGTLPAWPIRVACSKLKERHLEPERLLGAMADAVGVFYNSSGEAGPCFDYRSSVNNETREDGEFWDWQYCTEMFMPFERDGEADMFWRQPFDKQAAIKECQRQWGVTPRPMWPTIHYGGRRIDAASNIVFTNGKLDPWSLGGVLSTRLHSIAAIVIDDAAHHLDLMFSHPGDTRAVKEARRAQRDYMHRWIEEAWRRYPEDGGDDGAPRMEDGAIRMDDDKDGGIRIDDGDDEAQLAMGPSAGTDQGSAAVAGTVAPA